MRNLTLSIIFAILCITRVSSAECAKVPGAQMSFSCSLENNAQQIICINLVQDSKNGLVVDLATEAGQPVDGGKPDTTCYDGKKLSDGSTIKVSGSAKSEIKVTQTQLYSGIFGERSQWRTVVDFSADKKTLTIQDQTRNKSIIPKPWDGQEAAKYNCAGLN
jgi:hypothetical protein